MERKIEKYRESSKEICERNDFDHSLTITTPFYHHTLRLSPALPLSLSVETPGDWDAGERGLAAVPGREEDFWKAFTIAVDYAVTLKCNKCVRPLLKPTHTARVMTLALPWNCVFSLVRFRAREP
jgi:hydroxypyruvate isomerase